jgi:hypothetical protein
MKLTPLRFAPKEIRHVDAAEYLVILGWLADNWWRKDDRAAVFAQLGYRVRL